MKIESFCPQSGIDVAVDEDGLCASCGCTATGEALTAIARRAEVVELKRRVRLARAESLGQGVNIALRDLLDLRRPLPKRR